MQKRKYIVTVFLLLFVTGCQETILHDLDEAQANQVKIALSQRGIVADKLREGASWNLAVASSEVNNALSAIENTRILRRSKRRQIPERSNSLLQTAEDRVRAHEKELSVHLEKTLERFPRVLEARVHLNLSTPRSMSILDDAEGDSASVLLVTLPATPLREADIQRIVAGASGIPPRMISVVAVASTEREMAVTGEAGANKPGTASENVSDEVPVVKKNTRLPLDSVNVEFADILVPITKNRVSILMIAGLLLLLLAGRRTLRNSTTATKEEVPQLRPPKEQPQSPIASTTGQESDGVVGKNAQLNREATP